jgi:hypothetical protein
VTHEHRAANAFDLIQMGDTAYLSIGLVKLTFGTIDESGLPYSTQPDWETTYVVPMLALRTLRDLLNTYVANIEAKDKRDETMDILKGKWDDTP